MVLFSTLTVSTMPMMVQSTGSFSVSGVSPAPTVSTTTKVRPVLTSLSRWPGSTRSGSTVSSLRPVIEATFCVATTLPVTLARNMGASPSLEQFFGLPGHDQLLVGGHGPQLHPAARGVDRRLPFGGRVRLGVEHDAE